MPNFERIVKLRGYRRYRSLVLLAADLVIVSAMLAIAAGLESMGRPTHFGGAELVLIASGLLVVYGTVFTLSGINRSLWTFIGIRELVALGCSVLLASMIGLLGLIFISGNAISSLRFSFMSACMIFLGMGSFRILYRVYREALMRQQSSAPRERALIVGADESGYILLKGLQRDTNFHIDVVGFIDGRRVGHVVSGVRVLGGYDDLEQIISDRGINSVFIVADKISKTRRADLIKRMAAINVKVKVMRFDEESSDKDSPRIEDVSVEDLLGRGQVKLEQAEVASYLTGSNVLVTGAGGSIGSQLVREIIKFKPSMICMVDVNENGMYLLERELDFIKTGHSELAQVEIHSLIVNIREAEELDRVFVEYDINVVFHAAAHKHVPLMEKRPKEAIKNNVFGTRNVINAAINNKAERLIMISTDKAVNPTNVMGASKRLTEMMLQSQAGKSSTKLAAVRFGNVLGSNGSVIPIFKEQIRKGGPVTITNKEITRYFMTIPEASQLVLQAGVYADKGEIFVLDMGKPVKIISLAENLIRLSGHKPYTEIDIIETGLRPGEKMYEELFLHGERHTKTKNDLIYKNYRQNIDCQQLEASLSRLWHLVEDDSPASDMKQEIFEAINSKHKESQHAK